MRRKRIILRYKRRGTAGNRRNRFQRRSSTLPDPQVVLQQMNVGSARPFAGYTNSDFAYIGLGFSQDLPYPGKLRLRGEIAQKEADATQQKYESVRRAVMVDLKMAYFQLGYLAKRQKILDEDAQPLGATRTDGGVPLSERHRESTGCSPGATRTHKAASRNQYESTGTRKNAGSIKESLEPHTILDRD